MTGKCKTKSSLCTVFWYILLITWSLLVWSNYNSVIRGPSYPPGSSYHRGQGIWCDTLGLTFRPSSFGWHIIVDWWSSMGVWWATTLCRLIVAECMTPNLFWIRMLPPQFSREVRGKEYDRQILWLGKYGTPQLWWWTKGIPWKVKFGSESNRLYWHDKSAPKWYCNSVVNSHWWQR